MIIWFLPHSEKIDPRAWKTLAVFVYTLLCMILKPIPIGAATLSSLIALTLLGVLNFQEAFSGFTNQTVWLIVVAFFIARGFIKTGLGLRIAYNLMQLLGKSTLGMAYGFAFTDLILASCIPSVTARTGGIIYPVILSLSESFGSFKHQGPRKIGAFLLFASFQCSVITSAMFLTGMSGNPMVQSFAGAQGVSITWTNWAIGAFVPGILSLILVPLVLYLLYPPTVKYTPEAKAYAKAKLKEMGKITLHESLLIGVFCFMILFWIFANVVNVPATITALIGLFVLVVTGVVTWEDVLKEKGAWDTLIWFASLIAIASALNQFGLMHYFSDLVKFYIGGFHWKLGFLLIILLYYYSHYFFASNVAHITAVYAPFLALSIAIGAPPLLAALFLGFLSSLFGGISTYGSGPAPIFFGAGYIGTKEWWVFGFVVSLVIIITWGLVGSVWWRLIGLY